MNSGLPALVLILVLAQLGLYPDEDATTPGYSVISGDLSGDHVVLHATVVATDVSEPMLNVEFAVQVNGLADALLIGGEAIAWENFCGVGAVWELDGTSCGGAPVGPDTRIPILSLQIEGRPLVETPKLCLAPPLGSGPSFYSSPPTISYVRSLGPPVEWVAFDLVESGCVGPITGVNAGALSWGAIKALY